MGNLGDRPAKGVTDPNNPLGAGFWTVSFTPQVTEISDDYEIYHVALKGPAGSSFQVYKDSVFYDNVRHGDINSWDPKHPMYVHRGNTVFFYFNTATAPAPVVNIFVRTPTNT